MATIKSIKEKAKAYDEAIEVAQRFYNNSVAITKKGLEDIFPELKESDKSKDERIRKALIRYFTLSDEHAYNEACGVSYRDIVAWLEKQGKKTKPIEGFNTEFERQVSCLIASAMNKDYEYTKDFVKWTSDALLNYAKLEIEKNSMGISEATKKKLEDNLNKALEKETPESWNKFLEKQGEQKHICKLDNSYTRVKFPFKAKVKSSGTIVTIHGGQLSPDGKEWVKYQSDNKDGYKIYEPNNLELVCEIEQKPAEWSEEDIVAIDCAVEVLSKDLPSLAASIERLKSLRDRYTWKPSDEQMDALRYVTNFDYGGHKATLVSLYEQLKKLK